MKQIKQIFLGGLIAIIFSGCYFFDSKKTTFSTDSFDVDEFKSIIGLQIEAIDRSSMRMNLKLKRFFKEGGINADIKIKESNKTLLVQQAHLDATGPLQGRLFVAWVERTTQGNNILFSGEVLEIQKSLMTDMKEILKGTSKEIEQSVIDTKRVSKSLLFSNLSFTFTFYPDDKGYWHPKAFVGKPWIMRSIPIDMSLNNVGDLLTWQEYLTNNANPSDQLSVHVINEPSRNRKNVKVTTDFYQVPKTVITEIQQVQKGTKLVVNKNKGWTQRVSLTINLSSPYLLRVRSLSF